jgi:pimeloyl-ACP methyl ester carboxylesterase
MICYPFGVSGLSTRVLEAGQGDSYVLLAHGAGARADRWYHNLGPLANAGHHVFAVDLPGHGFAQKGADIDCSVPGYSAFLLAFLDAMRIPESVLVGTSLGGHAAAHAALHRSRSCRALVLVGSTGLAVNGPERRARTAARLRDTTRHGIIDKLHAVVRDSHLVDERWIAEEVRVNNSPGAAESFERLARYFEERLDDDCVGNALPDFATRVPMLLIWGAQDALVPVEVARQAQAAMPEVGLVEIEAAGHAPYFERPDEFNAALIEFLARLDVRRSPTGG